MKATKPLFWLSALIALLAAIAAGLGLIFQVGGSAFSFTTLHGESVQVYGHGLYRYDTPLIALGNRAGDAITLVVGIPLLILSLLRAFRGSLRSRLWLSGMLAYFLYSYGSLALGAAYNPLFLIYVALVSASLFGVVLALTSFDLAALPGHFSSHLPRRAIAVLLFAAALSLLLVWLGLSLGPALLQGKAPVEVASYTTLITQAVDLGVLVPTLLLTGVLLLRRVPLGYLLVATILVFTATLGTNLMTAGVVQLLAGVVTTGQFIGFTVPFALLTLCDIALTVRFFRACTVRATWGSLTVREARA